MISLLFFSFFSLGSQPIELDRQFLSGCQPVVGQASCDGKIFLGKGAGFGSKHFPENIMGSPKGNKPDVPQVEESEILSLGESGWIVLKFKERVVDHEGPDFRIFENVFHLRSFDNVIQENRVFTEVAFVEVSQDGKEFFRFPISVRNSQDQAHFLNPHNFSGFAGVFPTYATTLLEAVQPQAYDKKGNRAFGIGPGGDDFDISELGLSWIQYVKIIDAGNEVIDRGNFPRGKGNGFDLDAVVGIKP